MPDQIVRHPALTGTGGPVTPCDRNRPAATEAWLDAIVERNTRKLEDLRRTVELLLQAEEAMTAVDIDRMVALADILRARVDARAAEREGLKAA